ncbi:hypothetical protein EUGRSUZ_D02101 [Eucalyptus grandis]|uniref:Uncharacterized protein n=2 Tax=Eucalyptus grandis TaxID=71139 RepID=A0ACC3L6Z7_EUCGR|nr:hypothetical protein EUGRSUZ_D02101 [Eucalyptus grandis]
MRLKSAMVKFEPNTESISTQHQRPVNKNQLGSCLTHSTADPKAHLNCCHVSCAKNSILKTQFTIKYHFIS